MFNILNHHRKLLTRSLIAALVIISITCAPSAYRKDQVYRLTILHTNDHHGHFWKNSKGEYGMAARMTLIRQIRAEVRQKGGHVLLLSGGDINTGVPESDLQDAEGDFKAMNLLGYDAMAVGNHEFDNPREVLERQQGWIDFPMLAANIFDKKSGKRAFQPYASFNLDGLQVYVVGFTTEDTPILTNPENTVGLDFRPPPEVAKELIPQLRTKADLVIAVTHMGHYDNAAYGTNAPGDVTLARSVDGIDIIVGGHSQNPIFEPDAQNNTYILQAHEWGKYLGRMDLEFLNGQITLKNYRLIPVNLKKKAVVDGKETDVFVDKEIPEDPEVLKFLRTYQDQGDKKLSVEVGEVDDVLVGERDVVRSSQTNLGFLISLAQMEKSGADIGILNSGGVRTSIQAGKVTYKDILKVHPFGNMLCTVTLSGKELREYLKGVVKHGPGSGGYPQFAGLVVARSGGRITSVKVNGQEIADDGSYKVSINSFSAAGGGDYPDISGNTGFMDADVLKEYFEEHSPIKAADYTPTEAIVGN